ncbi:divergent polysaccharide deacetylase family protein [Pokkaliibacter sp. CJK22405]|uniref:divergent polysaccharide deacetylase family protein n=1 Tax=Pokkaliibacter sp. CJK22405 TaxID=3384615 RepID=UPI00398477D0
MTFRHFLGRVAATAALIPCLALAAGKAPADAPAWPRPLPADADPSKPVLVLIIDDIGQNLDYGKQALALPGPMTFAFLPQTPHAVELAKAARAQGSGLLLHAPMANQHHYPLGPGGLTLKQNREELQQTLEQDLADLPPVDGVNNHMGSALTEDRERMNWVMEILKPRKLYFLDSRTTAATVATASAFQHQVPWLQRDVFLDDDKSLKAIAGQLERAATLAKRHGYAIAIGHPYPETLKVLGERLPELRKEGFRQMSTTQLLSWLDSATGNTGQPSESAPALPEPVEPQAPGSQVKRRPPAVLLCMSPHRQHWQQRSRGYRPQCP